MKNSLIVSLLSIITFSFCQSNKRQAKNIPLVLKETDSNSKEKTTVEEIRKNGVLDSIFLKLDLSASQIRLHTNIDTVFLRPTSSFSGDTVYYVNDKYAVAVIIYDDGLVCLNKFLVVFRIADIVNTDLILGETQCDEDESSDYSRRTFKFINDSSFIVDDVYYERTPGHKTKVDLEKSTYEINRSGKLDLVKIDSTRES